MVQSCVVVGCTNRWTKGTGISWHRFPPEHQAERRKRWLNAINRKDWIPKANDRVCGIHFIKGCASLDAQDPDYAPSVNLGYSMQCTTPKVKVDRFQRARNRQNAKEKKETDENEKINAASVLLNLHSSFSTSNECDADTENSPPKPINNRGVHAHCVEEIEQLKLQNKQLLKELGRLQEEKRQLENEHKDGQFGLSFLHRGNSDFKINFYTGLPNLAIFLWLVDFVTPSLSTFQSVDNGSAVLIVLMKLRLNLQNYDLGNRFNISATTVSDVLNKSFPVIAEKLKFLIHWPEKDDVVRTLPKVFKDKTYRNARSIIDCTEIFIDRPGNLTARGATWSNYKHHNTLKYLISITPCGAVSFVSKAFGGRTSDKVVTQRSGFLDLLEYNDLILADRGFLIEEDILARNCHLVMPSFTKGQSQLTQRQVETSRQLSRVRIHVERAIERIKNFKVLCSSISLSLVPHVDSILTICSAISNLQPRLVK